MPEVITHSFQYCERTLPNNARKGLQSILDISFNTSYDENSINVTSLVPPETMISLEEIMGGPPDCVNFERISYGRFSTPGRWHLDPQNNIWVMSTGITPQVAAFDVHFDPNSDFVSSVLKRLTNISKERIPAALARYFTGYMAGSTFGHDWVQVLDRFRGFQGDILPDGVTIGAIALRRANPFSVIYGKSSEVLHRTCTDDIESLNRIIARRLSR